MHQPLPDPISGFSFNKACGDAVDSNGDIYVSSAGDNAVEVFDPAGNHLETITDPSGPCGIAVDPTGRVYVSESITGQVVRYTPSAYPFSGTPSYSAPVTIDFSGSAKGIAVDPTDARLYVAEGDHITSYSAEGTPGVNEAQRIRVDTASAFTLSFEGAETGPLHEPSHAEVEKALEELPTIGSGNVSVSVGPDGTENDHRITFVGALGGSNVGQITSSPSAGIVQETITQGFDGHIGEGLLSNATGVAVYTSVGNNEKSTRYLFAADGATDQVKVFSGPLLSALKLRKSIKGPKAGENFGFGVAGAYLAADPGNGNPVSKECSSISEQACTAGHFFIYDDAHKVVDEFEASGEYVTQISNPGFADAQPTAVAVDRSSGSSDGTIYVTSGASVGAKALAFAPLPAPSRPPRPDLSFALAHASSVAVDSYGNRYVAADAAINVYPPASGTPLTTIGDSGKPLRLAVDSACNVYALNRNGGIQQEKLVYYTSESCPPKPGTKYSGPTTVAATGPPYFSTKHELISFGVNPASDHVYVGQNFNGGTIELDSAKNGSGILNPDFASGLSLGDPGDFGVYGANGDIYVFSEPESVVYVVDPSGTEILARIAGAGSPRGPFAPGTKIAINQANGHFVAFNNERGVAEEYEASGAFVGEFGSFNTEAHVPYGVAVDSSCSLHKPSLTPATSPCEEFDPSNGNVYVAFDDPTPETFDLWAFGPLAFGEPPISITGVADGVGATGATLRGTVDPRGFELDECDFEWGEFGEPYEHIEPCAETPAEIGHGNGPVPVHLVVSGLTPQATSYHFRLIAKNKYGMSQGEDAAFGPPVVEPATTLPILYTEATLRARINPSGLATKYHFDYVTREHFEAEGFEGAKSTPEVELAPDDKTAVVQSPLTGLSEGTKYLFRVIAENEAKRVVVEGLEMESFTTLERAGPQECPNAEYRIGRSAALSDCRAYELVTPPETRGAAPLAQQSPFSDWLVSPREEGAGERVSFFAEATLPGFEGNGRLDGYRAQRTTDEGPHPGGGWTTELVGPSYAQAGGGKPEAEGVASSQQYSLWRVNVQEAFDGTLPAGDYLRTPTSFEALGRGSLSPHTDPLARGRYVSADGTHVIFTSKEHLEAKAAPQGTEAIYDRAAGSPSASVVSLKPGGAAFGASEDAVYVGVSEDGSAVAFKDGGALYLKRDGHETLKVAEAPNAFAGVSEDGKQVFYIDEVASGTNPPPAGLFAFNAETSTTTEIAPDSQFVNVSADGSRVYFTSTEVLDDASEGTLNQNNLYLWERATGSIRFVARLDPRDLDPLGFEHLQINLVRWIAAVGGSGEGGLRGDSPTRSTPDGAVLVFQSHAQLTSYDNTEPTAAACGDREQAGERCSEVYRYDAAANGGEGELTCISCDPTGAPPTSDASLQSLAFEAHPPVTASTLIANVTDNGKAVFFESEDALLPEDANGVRDVYEWEADGAEGCKREGGCLALISSGQGEEGSHLYGVTPADAHDVFFTTTEKLVGADIPESPSIYDARVDGGIPAQVSPAPCRGDACQGEGSQPPQLPSPASSGSGDGNEEPSTRCAKGKHRAKGRCVKSHKRHRRKQRRANHKRRASR